MAKDFFVKQLKNFGKYLKNRRFQFFYFKFNKDVKNLTLLYLAAIVICVDVFFLFFSFQYFTLTKVNLAPDWVRNVRNLTKGQEFQSVDDNCPLVRKIDGVCVNEASQTDLPVIAVMVENHSVARPLAGIAKANLVYEALVEGGITRMLAVFATDEEVPRIGPVRSARPYYLRWAKELDALYAHVGGSPESLLLISKYVIKDFDEYFKGGYFWRDSKREAPHNVYTSLAELKKGWQGFYPESQNSKYEAWQFQDEPAVKDRGPDLTEISIPYSGKIYDVIWKYHQEKNIYERMNGGKSYVDEDGASIFVKNIVVQYTQTKVIDDIGRLYIENIGTGKAEIFANGRSVQGTWEKSDLTHRTKFYDDKGKEIIFTRGNIWINVVPEDTALKIN